MPGLIEWLILLGIGLMIIGTWVRSRHSAAEGAARGFPVDPLPPQPDEANHAGRHV